MENPQPTEHEASLSADDKEKEDITEGGKYIYSELIDFIEELDEIDDIYNQDL